MRHLSWRLPAKAVAWILLAVVLCTLAVSGLGAGFWYGGGGNYDGGAYLREQLLNRACSQLADEAYYGYYNSVRYEGPDRVYWENRFSSVNSNFRFVLTDAKGQVLLRNEAARQSQYHYETQFEAPTNAQYTVKERFDTREEAEQRLDELYDSGDYVSTGGVYEIYPEEEPREEPRFEVYAECFQTEVYNLSAEVPIPSELKARDGIWLRLQLVQALADAKSLLLPGLAVSGVLCLLLLGFLFCGAGHRRGSDEIHLRWCDRIPAECLIFVGILLVCLPILIWDAGEQDWMPLLALAAAVPAVMGCVWILTSFAVRLKARCFWRSTIVGWLVYLLWRGLRSVFRGLKYLVQGLPLVWQVALGWMVLSFLELLLMLSFHGNEAIWLLERIILTPLLLIVSIQLTRLRQGARRIADGDLSTEIDLRYMVGDIRRHGQDLNRITDGLQSAVDERMRSERLKTELITNVSHDIKTPLTSIVNYVDLLSREEMPSETAKEYLEVLKRQSARLRKLTEDLVEASKAATGNVEVRPEPMDVNVLLTQTIGEFEEKLRSLELEPVLTLGEDPMTIHADGRLLWRVFDNLMGNICKYALPGTRVYLSAQRKEGQVEIVFRNISRYPLNISSDELIERFVRGDASRSTEGSGLGLSIAKSLTDLQGGQFDLIVDGDLFKAIVTFPAL